jgi:ribosome maturation factor RimP
MTDKAENIARLLAPTVTSLGLELLGIEYLPAPGGALVRLYIDVPQVEAAGDEAEPRSVGIEDCESVSREVSAQLDVEDPITANYTLEVSSPGIDRPLFGAAQFARFVGESAKVTLKLPQDGRRRLQGAILRVDGETIVFGVDSSEFVVDAGNIEKARLIPDWVALGLAPAVDKSGRDARPGKQDNKQDKQKKAAGRKPAAKSSTNKSTAHKPSDAE